MCAMLLSSRGAGRKKAMGRHDTREVEGGLYEGDITRIIALLQREGRVTYWVLQHEFGLGTQQ